MFVSSDFLYFCHCERSKAIQSSLRPLWIASRSLSSGTHSRDPLARNDGLRFCDRISGREFRQRRVERRGGTRQILERQPAIGRLLLRLRRGGTNLGHRLCAIEQGPRRDYMKLMGLDRLILEQEDAQRDDVLAAPI